MGQKNRIKDGAKTKLSTEIKDELKKVIDDLPLFDDDLMSKVFDRNIEAAELLLRIVLERDDIRVKSVRSQVELRSASANGRNIRLDVLAEDFDGNLFNAEVQRNPEGANAKRGRYHQSMMDSRLLMKRQDFESIKDTYVIFICEHDKFNQNKPIYHVEKTIRETGEGYDDGAHILYVNGEYFGNDDIGKLMHDFNCKNTKEFYFKPLADGVRHFKETEKGREAMGETLDSLARKYAHELAGEIANEMVSEKQVKTRSDDVKTLMKSMKLTLEQALNALNVQGKERAIIAKQLQK